MRSYVFTIAEGMKVKNQNKTKIGMGYVLKAKVVELDKITMEGRIRGIRKEVVICVQYMVGKNNFLDQFEDEQKKEISSSLLFF